MPFLWRRDLVLILYWNIKQEKILCLSLFALFHSNLSRGEPLSSLISLLYRAIAEYLLWPWHFQLSASVDCWGIFSFRDCSWFQAWIESGVWKRSSKLFAALKDSICNQVVLCRFYFMCRDELFKYDDYIDVGLTIF